jgi:hypothetical protein
VLPICYRLTKKIGLLHDVRMRLADSKSITKNRSRGTGATFFKLSSVVDVEVRHVEMTIKGTLFRRRFVEIEDEQGKITEAYLTLPPQILGDSDDEDDEEVDARASQSAKKSSSSSKSSGSANKSFRLAMCGRAPAVSTSKSSSKGSSSSKTETPVKNPPNNPAPKSTPQQAPPSQQQQQPQSGSRQKKQAVRKSDVATPPSKNKR